MEIVIKIHDIPQNDHERWVLTHGTPLPKQHGRLKDADKLYNIFNELCDEYNIDNMSFISEMNMNFDLAPTIIEADGGGDDEEKVSD